MVNLKLLHESITNTVSGDTDASYKSIVGGSGTLGTLTTGDQSEKLIMSPRADFILNPSKKQVNLDEMKVAQLKLTATT